MRREQNSHEGGFAADRAATGRRAENIGPIERTNSSTGEVRCKRDNTKDKGSTAPRNAALRSGVPLLLARAGRFERESEKTQGSLAGSIPSEQSPIQTTGRAPSSSIFCFQSRTDA